MTLDAAIPVKGIAGIVVRQTMPADKTARLFLHIECFIMHSSFFHACFRLARTRMICQNWYIISRWTSTQFFGGSYKITSFYKCISNSMIQSYHSLEEISIIFL